MTKKELPITGVGFATLDLDQPLLSILSQLGYEEPTPIQSAAIPLILAGQDLLGQAATGTGKTAAFALPIIQRLARIKGRSGQPSVLILVPTRELAMQVAEAIHTYGHSLGIRVLPIYGGQPYEKQLRGLDAGVDVVVGTPGRILDHIDRKTLILGKINTVVLDEADEMLDMGFVDDIDAIFSHVPKERQVLLFSATMAPRVVAIAKRHQREAASIKIGQDQDPPGSAPRVRQTAYVVMRAQKIAALSRLLDHEDPAAAIIFCRTRTDVDEVTQKLQARGQRSEGLHGGLTQQQRDAVIRRLRNEEIELVVATDVAARGLDFDKLSHIFNFDIPSDSDSYVHRIGRVGRARRKGVAITLLDPREHQLLRSIERNTKQKIEVARLPTLADLRARRLELTRSSLSETIEAGDLDHFRSVVDALAGEFELMDIALAAVKLAHRFDLKDADEEDIASPDLSSSTEKGSKKKHGLPGETVRLYINIGRSYRIFPQDLVAAISTLADIKKKNIGAISITDQFSLVEVPKDMSASIIEAMGGAKIKGKKISVRLDHKTK